MGDKKDRESKKIFDTYSMGIKTNRDVWVYNASRQAVISNLQGMVSFYNAEVHRYSDACENLAKSSIPAVEDFINADPSKISWSRALRAAVEKRQSKNFKIEAIGSAIYRPFCKTHVYFDRDFVNDVALIPRFFPSAESENRVIQVNANYSGEGQISLISDLVPDLHANGDALCFPLYLYDAPESGKSDDLFASDAPKQRTRRRRHHQGRLGPFSSGLSR